MIPACADFRQSAERVFNLTLKQIRTISYRAFLPYERFAQDSLGTPASALLNLLGRMSNLTSFESLKQGDYALIHVERVLTSAPQSLKALHLSDSIKETHYCSGDDWRYLYASIQLVTSLGQKCFGITHFSYTSNYTLDDEQMSLLLSHMQRLQVVCLAENYETIGKETVAILSKTPSITSLDLRKYNSLDIEDVTGLLRDLPKLTELNISDGSSLGWSYSRFSLEDGSHLSLEERTTYIKNADDLAHAFATYGTKLTILKMNRCYCTKTSLAVITQNCRELRCLEGAQLRDKA